MNSNLLALDLNISLMREETKHEKEYIELLISLLNDELINTNEIGELRVVNVRVRWCRPDRYYNLSRWRGTYSQDGGALTNQGIHHIDLLRYLFGEVIELNAQMKTLGANIEVEDSVVATMRLKKNIIGTLEVTTAARPHDYEASISVLGSKGMAQLGGWAVNELNEFSPKEEDCKKFSENGKTNTYEYKMTGFNLKMSSLNAALGIAHLKRFKKFTVNTSVFYRQSDGNIERITEETGEIIDLIIGNDPDAPLLQVPVLESYPINSVSYTHLRAHET